MNVLVLSATASAINIINSLGKIPGVNLCVTDASRYACGLYLPGVKPFLISLASQSDNYRSALDRIISSQAIDVLLPSSDKDTAAVLELIAGGWRPKVKLFEPSYDVFRVLSDKWRLMEALQDRFSANVPRTFRNAEIAIANGIGFPVVVKPTREGGTKGVAIVHDRQTLDHHVRTIVERFGHEYVVQEYVPGETGSIYMLLFLYGLDGNVIIRTAMRSSLTFMTWGGGGNAGNIVDEPELLDLAERMVASIGKWQGPVNVEFKRHADTGRFMLMEVNCRLNGYSYLTTMNGLDYPAAMLRILSGERVVPPPPLKPHARQNFVLGFRETLVNDWVAPLTHGIASA